MFPTAYSTRINYTSTGIDLWITSDTGKEKLNIDLISFRFNFYSPPDVSIMMRKAHKDKSGISDILKTRFVAKDPLNYEKLIDDNEKHLVINTDNHEITKSEAQKIVHDFFESLFAPNMRESLLPLYPEDLGILQEALIKHLNYHMPTVTTTPWTPKLFAQGSVAKEARDTKQQSNEQSCTWTI